MKRFFAARTRQQRRKHHSVREHRSSGANSVVTTSGIGVAPCPRGEYPAGKSRPAKAGRQKPAGKSRPGHIPAKRRRQRCAPRRHARRRPPFFFGARRVGGAESAEPKARSAARRSRRRRREWGVESICTAPLPGMEMLSTPHAWKRSAAAVLLTPRQDSGPVTTRQRCSDAAGSSAARRDGVQKSGVPLAVGGVGQRTSTLRVIQGASSRGYPRRVAVT